MDEVAYAQYHQMRRANTAKAKTLLETILSLYDESKFIDRSRMFLRAKMDGVITEEERQILKEEYCR